MDRQRLGLVFRRCAHAGEGIGDVAGAVRCLSVDRNPDRNDLHICWPCARAGLHLHVPVTADSGRTHRRMGAQRHLPPRPWRTRVSVKKAEQLRQHGEPAGDCIDCHQCINVCPTGVDIRDKIQLGCVQCGLCIDACYTVISEIGHPAGLIAYDTDINGQRHFSKKDNRTRRRRLSRTNEG